MRLTNELPQTAFTTQVDALLNRGDLKVLRVVELFVEAVEMTRKSCPFTLRCAGQNRQGVVDESFIR